MKEVTFEELLEDYMAYESMTETQKLFIKNMMQQVKEATKEDVLKLADDNFFSKEPKGKLMENIENLPTDRIKTNEKA